jgi:hypothetical protein
MAESTVAGLNNAQTLSDNDMFPVSQPDAYNPITQSQGDTRKITLQKHAEYLEGTLVTKRPMAAAQVLRSDLAFDKGKELLGTKASGTRANLAALKTYNEGEENQIEQVEIGSETEHLNLNTSESGEFKDHISVDTKDPVTHAAKKEIVAYMSDVHGPFGFHMEFEFEPTPLELALWRCLPLRGQVIPVSDFQRLCDRMYCGNAANATAAWWYKTSDPEGLVRDVNGAYMRVLDHRGVFPRPTGQNSLYKCANNAPYDGGSIGSYSSDSMQPITGILHFLSEGRYVGFKDFTAGEAFVPESTPGSDTEMVAQVTPQYISSKALRMNSSLVTRTGPETKPASISSCLCIKY